MIKLHMHQGKAIDNERLDCPACLRSAKRTAGHLRSKENFWCNCGSHQLIISSLVQARQDGQGPGQRAAAAEWPEGLLQGQNRRVRNAYKG
jgi:hypothetical protein